MTMRTIGEIEDDIHRTMLARESMAALTNVEPEGQRLFLENCDRELALLKKELRVQQQADDDVEAARYSIRRGD